MLISFYLIEKPTIKTKTTLQGIQISILRKVRKQRATIRLTSKIEAFKRHVVLLIALIQRKWPFKSPPHGSIDGQLDQSPGRNAGGQGLHGGPLL